MSVPADKGGHSTGTTNILCLDYCALGPCHYFRQLLCTRVRKRSSTVSDREKRDVYILDEEASPSRLCSVLFTPVAKDKTVLSTVSLLRFVYDETEARTHRQEARDIAGEVARFLAEHVIVDTQEDTVRVESQNTQTMFQLTGQKLFFVSFKNGDSVQAVPEGVAEVSVLGKKENNSVEYLYKKEKEHGNLFDSFLITEECKYEGRWKGSRIRNFPAKRKKLLFFYLFPQQINLSFI
ncbi:MAG: uncharacterized protein A8A55_3202 [Amphiamblys sp. WSBS2006]|nr:MAG: uncharacterized protein A8A55_3202 [Amphiamblys sp. WSBS2006]